MNSVRRALLLALGLLVLAGGLAQAKNYSYGTWSFELPDDEKGDGPPETARDGLLGYAVPGASYLFTPPEPLSGRTLEALAQATMTELLGSAPREIKLLLEETDKEGGQLRAYLVVQAAAKGELVTQLYQFFARAGQWGLLLTTFAPGDPPQAVSRAAVAVMRSARFDPPSLSAQAGGGDSLMPSSALPKLPWPQPRADRVATAHAKLSYPAARKLGLNPSRDLLPDTFDCYRTNDASDAPLRPLTPTPDARITVQANGSYTLNDGRQSQTGRWRTEKDGDFRKYFFEGPVQGLRQSSVYLDARDDRGQKFEVYVEGLGRVVCPQQGPRAEALRLDLARASLGTETFRCLAREGPPFDLKFAGGTYTSGRGNGRVRAGLRLDGSGRVTAKMDFTGGPLSGYDGELSEDDTGNRTLDVQRSVSTGSIFARQTITTLLARCTARVTPRPQALYGPVKAPPGTQKGGLSGLYLGYVRGSTMIGMISMPTYFPELYFFTPDGYYLPDVDPSETGTLPDCTRTRPNGDPLCLHYELKGSTIRLQDDDLSWDDPANFERQGNGFVLDGQHFTALSPLKALPAGTYSAGSKTGGGLGGSPSSGYVRDLSNGYRFTKDGKFEWHYDSSGTTTVGQIGFQPGILASASSSRTDGGSGTFTLSGYWLTLKFSDGRVRRLFTYAIPQEMQEEKSVAQLSIGGTTLNLVSGP